MSYELPEAKYAVVERLCREADVLVEQSSYDEAIDKYKSALENLPPPIAQWEAGKWILTAIGDAYFLKRDFHNAARSLLDAMKCPGAIGNPFIHLRLGQSQLELGNEILAKDELARELYMAGGAKVFDREDAKYFNLVKSALKPPPGGWE